MKRLPGQRECSRATLHPITHHFQQPLRVLDRILTVRHAQFLIQITDMRLDGGRRYRQFASDLLVAVAGIDQPQHLPFALRQRAGAD